jgi:dynein heavy chain
MKSVTYRFNEVTRLFNLMEQYNISSNLSTDFALFQTLAPTVQQLNEVIEMAVDTKEDNINKFSVELEKNYLELLNEVLEIRNKVQEPIILNKTSKCENILQLLNALSDGLQKLEDKKCKFEEWEKLFVTENPNLDKQQKTENKELDSKKEIMGETKTEVELKRTLWKSIENWKKQSKEWKTCHFDTLDTEAMNTDIQALLKTIYSLDKGLPPNDVVPYLRDMVQEIWSIYPTIVDLRNPALKQRHWDKIQEVIGKAINKEDDFNLGKLMEENIFDFKEEISNISSQASSEMALEEMLNKLIKLWNDTEFQIQPYRDYKDVFLLIGIEEIQTQLEDSQVTIATIKGSRHMGPIKNEVERWDKQLSLFADTLDAWLNCQRNWRYLESIFSAPDIQRQLPDESKMFSQVDRSWKEVMRKVARNPNAIKAGTAPGLLETMEQNNILLDKIQKCLEDYLESKRLLFPRFYFLSNEELLEILSQTRNPQAVQPHLGKCFDSIKSLEFGSEPKSIDIFAMNSPEGERVPFGKTLKARGNVENWLGSVEEGMVSILKKLIKVALNEYDEQDKNEWIMSHCGMVVLTVSQIIWCRDVTECLESNYPRQELCKMYEASVKNLNNLASVVRGNLTKLQRSIFSALITTDVHARDIVQNLIDENCTSSNDFVWSKQLRYYWDVNSDTCTIKMSTSVFNYGYEYLGCSPRLVITPLTDRCYLTLTGAINLNLGGSPVGPAGTGKTETVKDLSKALARQCVVFNCSDGLDYKMMGKMFAGLAQSGAWCCFDEFNRIDIEVLSVIAQQLLSITHAKMAHLSRFMFEGREIRLIDTCCSFITMNPGYAGRTELPDNLKALFRPIAMMIPDYGLIAEIILYSEGFENAKSLSGKVVNLYKLCSEQLSQQDHYDFGMRAVKSVLVMAGTLKRANPDLTEDVVLIRSLRDSNIPKFIAEDIPLFRGILQDLFPGIIIPDVDFGEIMRMVKEVMEEEKLKCTDTVLERIIQLYDTMNVRHGVMLVGPTGGGKTTAYEVLAKAKTKLKEKAEAENWPKASELEKVKLWVLNPKCVTMAELYGEFNLNTMEWKDGLVGYFIREQVADTSKDEKWTVFDGPVDALWIENMNSVLDDNKLLCLNNGERIRLNNTQHLVFEVADLAVASPATVSRCGMVYIDSDVLGWRPYAQTWLSKLPESITDDLKAYLYNLFENYIDSGLRFIRRNCKEYIPSTDFNLVTSLCKLYHSFIVNNEVNFKLNKKELKCILAYLFIFCYTWSLGGNLADGYHDAFDTFLKDMLENVPITEIHLPNTGNIFNYYIDFKKKTFVSWENIVPTFEYNPEIPYFQMIVPTPDTVKYTYLLKMLLNANYPVLFTGKTGVGKSVTIQDLISKTCREHSYTQININFSAQTTSSMTQEMIEIKLEKKRKNIFGAPGNSRIILFVDDLNMPKLDTYGSQPPIELLRQYIGSGGFYDREKLSWKVVQDVSIVAACAPPGGGRNVVTPRLIRYFNLLSLPNQSELSLNKIFKSILEGFLKPFSSEINSVCDAIIHSTIEIYERMCKELLPTPTKSHYTFNLRDLSKVIQGILQVNHKSIETKLDIVKLFCHESARVFQDRLIDDTDRTYFNNLLSELVDKNFNIQFTPESLMQQPILFGDFMKPGVPVEERVYVEINDLEALNSVLEDYLEEYNVMLSKNLRLIFFLDAKQHISRIARILRQPRGNAMLVGIGGTGKQSLTRLACHMSDYKCHQIELTRTYGMDEWREDIKKLYRLAGIENKNTVFLISDTQIKCETFLEDINNILNTGEIPNLFEFEEREKIIGDLRPVAKDHGLNEDRDSVLQFFTNRVRDNLHIVFGTSPVGDSFRNRCRMFPSLVNCCTIDWFDEWPKDALLSVSKKFLEYTDLGSDEMKEKISEMCVEIHASVSEMSKLFYEELRRHYYTTPVSYLELINLYIVMLQEKRKELSAQRDRLKNGLDKLNETNEMVANMQVELEQLQPVLVSKTADVESLMVQITKDQEVADGVRRVVSEEEAIVREKASQTQAIADEAQKDLDEALPALEAAYKALDALDKKDIAELKVFTKPPDLVLSVMEAICILFKVKPDWDSSKKLLGDPQIMKKMIEFDKDNIPELTTKKLKKYIENPNFTPENVEKVSKACKSMCMWVIALDKYSHIFREVQPKRKRLEEAQEALRITQEKLAEKTAALKQVEDQLNELKLSFENSNTEKQELINKKEETTRRLERASKLTLALADEQERWVLSVESLNNQIDALNGNVFLAAACVAYYGAFTSTYRQKLVKRWINRCQELEIPILESFNLIDTLSNQVMIREWNMQGLPSDTLSTENGILVTRGRRWPLMIDPQGQANRWIRSKEGSDLQVIKLSEPKFLRSLENAIRTGLPVLLEDVGETLDSALEPLLLKQTVRQGGRTLMKLGDSYVEYDKNFKLYITTKLPNPHYLPEICIKVTIINFTVTREGLEGQLLADVVKIERAELEEQRNELIVNISNDKKQLRDIEEKILKLLFNSEGNILDDEELINTLNKSKMTSAAIQQRVEQAEITEREINAAREKYLPVSIRGAIIYFVVANLAEIDPMYQFSLKYFKNLFNLCIKGMEKNPDLDVHIANMCKKITYTIFSNVSRGLFEKHKLIFSFMICIEILKEEKLVTDNEWNFFLRGSISQAHETPKPQINWISDEIWHEVLNLSESIENLSFVESTLRLTPDNWVEFMNHEEPFVSSLPEEKQYEISDIQKLIIIKVLREEMVVPSIISFIEKNIGKEFIDSIPLDISLIYKDTNFQTPLIFILSTGSDPTQILVKFSQSKEIKYENRLHIISLGQGQGPIAENLIRKAQSNGDWVFLQNCHLAKSWMNRLETIVKELSENPDEVNPDFRLYLSSMPSNIFPISVLQEGVKVTNEPPKGLKANLARSFADIDIDTYDGCIQNGSKFKKLLFGICFFNAVIHERKKFGPLGWNILYDWSTSDLEVSITILKNMMNDYMTVQWDALLYLTGEITFGGRVTDDWDRRALKCILRKYYCHEIFENNYLLSPNGIYYVPDVEDLNNVKKYIDSLPYTEDPSVFGMHENANISYQIQETRRVIKTIVDIQPRLVSSGSGKSNEEIVTELANNILNEWPSLLVIEMPSTAIQESSIEDENGEPVAQSTSSLKFMNSGVTEMMKILFEKDENGRVLNSLSTVLSQECVRFNRLLSTVKLSLENLIKAIKGFVVMSQELESVFDSLLNNEVPHAWSTVAYLSLKPLGGWVTDLHRRINFMADWIEFGQPKTFWLPGFFFPQGFLTGALQNHARKYNIPIDTLKFAYEIVPTNDDGTIIEDSYSTVEDGVLVEGLYIEGAHYDKDTKILQDSFAMEMHSLMPIIRFLPTENTQNQENQYVCPLYKTSERAGTLSTTGHSTNFIVAVNLPSDKSPDYWISRGVALLCQPD